jgi:hypothetical protein
LPDLDQPLMVYDGMRKCWQRVENMTSGQIRATCSTSSCITNTKLMNMNLQQAAVLYGKITKLRNVPNKTKILRLLHGDVYCGSRLYQFGLSTTDRCIRCFECETIKHLLLECPYTKEVWSRLGIVANIPSDLVRENISVSELEIMADLISSLVFRKQVLPPDVLIRSTVYKFKEGLSKYERTRKLAANMVNRYEIIGQWFT